MAQAGLQVDIRFIGDKELQRKLNRLDPEIQRRVLTESMAVAGEIVLKAAKANAPVRTGKHRDNIRMRKVNRKRGRNRGIGVEVVSGTRKKLGISPDDKFYYPAALEFGAPSRNIAARPHMRPALNNRRALLKLRIASHMGRSIELLAVRL